MFDLNVSSEEITDGSIPRALVLISVPLIAQNFAQVGQVVADLFWLGQYSTEAVGALGLASPIWFLLIVSIIPPTFGIQILVSQRVGGGDETGARRATFNGLVLAIVLGSIATVLGFYGAPWLVGSMMELRPTSAGRTVLDLTVIYVQTIAFGTVVAGMSDALEASFIARGDSRVALYANLSVVLVDVVLDPVFILGFGPIPEMGMFGAALASIGGYVSGLVLLVGFMIRGRGGILTRDAATLDFGDARELLSVGMPTGMQNAASYLVQMGLSVVAFLVAGGVGVAAYTVGKRVSSLALRPSQGFQQAAKSIIGQNIGAEKAGRATQTARVGIVISVATLATLGAVQWFFPRLIISILVPDMGPEAVEDTARGLRILALGYPAVGAHFMFEAGFMGLGRTRTTLAFSLLKNVGVQLPVALVAGSLLGYGLNAVFWAITLSNLVGMVALGAYYRFGVTNGMFDEKIDAMGD